jgi:hypothetical protein
MRERFKKCKEGFKKILGDRAIEETEEMLQGTCSKSTDDIDIH